MSQQSSHKQLLKPGLKRSKLIGPVRALREGFGLVQLKEHENVSLGKPDMRRVFPGDVVEVSAGSAGRNGGIQGRILQVLERNTTELVGKFNAGRGSLDSKHNSGFVVPSNSRISHDIHIPKKAAADVGHGQIVVVEITDQPGDSAPAYGRIKEILGTELSAGMEIQIALRNFAIPHAWPEAVEDEADKSGSSVKAADKKNRLDLRGMPFVTIDGEDARDFDDAVFAEKHGDGWRLWVAIADVSHYVNPGSALDTEAQNRGTSVYFPEYVVPMLPEVLSNGLCSLKPGVDRLALVCEMNIDQSGRITAFRFAEALIRSRERLTYTHVAKMMDGKVLAQQNRDERVEDPDATPGQAISGRKKTEYLCEHINRLHSLYQVLMSARQRRGAMTFETVDVRFEFDQNRKIKQVVPIHRNDAHKLIEECMLCANICAAEFLAKNELPGLYRVHMPPANKKLAALRDYLAELGLWLGGGEQPTPADFKTLVEAMGDRPDKSIIQTMMLRSQQQAVYQPENKGHFGLACDAYAHFTSPIRRYPDLLVHRAIRSVIRSGPCSGGDAAHVRRVEGASVQPAKRNYPYDMEAIQVLGQACSIAERRAEDATRDVAQWLKCEFLQKHLGGRFQGVVAAVTHFGLFVQMIDFYIEGLIHIANLPRDYYEYDPINQQLTGRSGRRTFKIGDNVMVQVARVDLDDRKIDLVLTNSADNGSTRIAGDSDKREEGARISRNDLMRSGRNTLGNQLKSGEKTTGLPPRPGAKKSGTRRSSGKKNPRRRK